MMCHFLNTEAHSIIPSHMLQILVVGYIIATNDRRSKVYFRSSWCQI